MEPTAKTETVVRSVQRHYGHTGILESILTALELHGIDTQHLQLDHLAPIDEFHVRAREASAELANHIQWSPGMRVLDVGCGIGGSSRYLATTYGCDVIGIDLTREFIDTAISLTKLVGLDSTVSFYQESATDMPFRDDSFDVVWTQHVQMNIEDKRRFYSEMVRVLEPGGKFLFHDVFASTPDTQPVFPVPWADDPSYSFLTTPDDARKILEDLGLKILVWNDVTEISRDWMIEKREATREAAKSGQAGLPPLSPTIIIGESGRTKMDNAITSLVENRLKVIMCAAEK